MCDLLYGLHWSSSRETTPGRKSTCYLAFNLLVEKKKRLGVNYVNISVPLVGNKQRILISSTLLNMHLEGYGIQDRMLWGRERVSLQIRKEPCEPNGHW